MAKIDKAKTPKEVVSRPRFASTEVYQIYDKALDILNNGVRAGVSNAPQGMTSLLLMANLLHGGAYAEPINKRPYYLFDRTQSPYWAGYISHSKPGTGGLYDALSSIWGGVGGTSAADLVEEILVDSNVPHVLPKLIDDECYATYVTTYCQLSTTDLFKQGAAGMKTLVEAASTGVRALRGGGGGKEEEEGYSESQMQKLLAALARTDTTAQDIGGD